MQTYQVVIVGAGPRGLGVLERISAIYAERAPDWGVQVHLVDPGEPGQGTHSSLQPIHLLANTIASQITLFTDASVREAGPIKPGLSLLDWARTAGYRRVAGTYVKTATDGEEIHENDYLPRALLGAYLTWVYDHLASALPPNMQLVHHRCVATDIVPQRDGRHCVEIEGGYRLLADCVVVTTGHSQNRTSDDDKHLETQVRAAKRRNPKLQFVRSVTPISVLQSISAQARVCVHGMGLTAYDIISELTVGRDGRFRHIDDRHLVYEPSGREPHLILTSRQGIAFAARGINQKGVAGLHRPVFFTKPWIDQVRREKAAATGSRKLDYANDLWPTLKKEICFVFDWTAEGTQPDPARYVPSAAAEQAITDMFSPLGADRFANEAAFASAVRRFTERDLEHAFGGNVNDPVKAATDVLRDVRDYVRYAVDYGGLTEDSHRHFLSDVIPVMYRISAGAPKERNMELLALLNAGIVTFGPGPSPELAFDPEQASFALRSTRLDQPAEQRFDVLVRARIDCAVYPERQDTALIRNLMRRGVARPFVNGAFHPGGLDVDTSQNVIDTSGRAHPNIWALGIITEGANFCTYVLPRALVNSRFIQFSGRCALSIFALLDRQHAEASAVAARTANRVATRKVRPPLSPAAAAISVVEHAQP